MRWIYEKYIFDRDDEFIQEVKNQGHECIVIDPLKDRTNIMTQYITDVFNLDPMPTIFRGSLQLGKKINYENNYMNLRWIPGAILNENNLKCSNYYAYWGEYLLNWEYFLLPLKELSRHTKTTEILYSFYSQDYSVRGSDREKVFIRPDSCMKIFHGGVMKVEEISKKLAHLDPTTLVSVSPIQKINQEYRFVVIDRSIISGSKYKEQGEDDYLLIDNQHEAWIYLEEALDQVEVVPDIAYVVDVGYVDEYRVIELNSFSCSGLYACDLPLIINKMSELAIKKYDE